MTVDLSNNGKSVVEAVRAKFDDSDDGDELDSILIPQNRRDAYSRLHSFLGQQFLTLDGLNICHSGKPGEISEFCPHVVELDLSGNDFKCWTEVFKVISQMPNLSFLNLSLNPLQPIFNKDEISKIVGNSVIPKVKRLILNNTFTPMEIVFDILSIIPSEELHLSLNAYGHFPAAGYQFPSICCLHFASNGISESNCFKNIGITFPSLKSLIFCENPLQDIHVDDISTAFPNLYMLSLSKTDIGDWRNIDALRAFPLLEDVRLVGIPLLNKHSADEGRHFVISRVPNMKKLNGSTIDPTERENAERKFIRYFMDREDRPSRYEELVAIHGVLQRLADVNLGCSMKASVTVVFEDRDLHRDTRIMTINLRQTTADLKRKLAKSVGRKTSQVRMFYKDIEAEHVYGAEEMLYGTRALYNYKIKDGDQIEVWLK